MAMDSPKLLRKNRIQPEISDDSIAWSESDAQELLTLPCALNDTVESLPKASVETSTFIAGTSTCVQQQEYECEHTQKGNLDQLQNRKKCILFSNLPWILITNSLLQVRVDLSLMLLSIFSKFRIFIIKFIFGVTRKVKRSFEVINYLYVPYISLIFV